MPDRITSADPRAGYLAAQNEIDAAIARVLRSGTYIHGEELAAFEREFAHWLGVAGAVGVANGTDALELALRALGVGPGDAVATVANTVTATAAAIVATGAEPVFVEIDPDTMVMDPAALADCFSTRRLRAVVPVHLYGQPCDVPRVLDIARRNGAFVVEDCAQAHGAALGGRAAGTWGDLAAFSFYPTKNLGALGDAGGVAGNDAALLERVRRLRQYGWRTRYVSEEYGRNSRLDEIQAAILRVRLGKLDTDNARRRELAEVLLNTLKGSPLRLPPVLPRQTHCWHQFVVRTPHRDALKVKLERENIFGGILYATPVHRQPGFAQAVSLPHTEAACAEVFSLPLHPGLTIADVERVAKATLAALAELPAS